MGRPDPFPTFAEATVEEFDELAWVASFADLLFSDILHIPKLASLRQHLSKARKILALLPCLLELLCLCLHQKNQL
jgi:hypothetical protein